jgi:hypothetical protein
MRVNLSYRVTTSDNGVYSMNTFHGFCRPWALCEDAATSCPRIKSLLYDLRSASTFRNLSTAGPPKITVRHRAPATMSCSLDWTKDGQFKKRTHVATDFKGTYTADTQKKNTVISRTCYEFKNRDDQGGNLRPDMIDTCANGSYQDGRIRHEGPEICVKGRRRNLTSNCQIERRFTIACTILRPLLYPTVAFNRRH